VYWFEQPDMFGDDYDI